MKKILFFAILVILLLIPEIASAQQVYPANGSLESSGDGLWNYYRGKTKTTVKRNAPKFERVGTTSSYLLDYTEIQGVELYLFGEFSGTRLAQLQIITPFPEYTSCKKDTKDTSRSFAEVGAALMGVSFTSKQCTTSSENGGTVVCKGEDFACVYRLCPEENWVYACSVLTK